MSFERDLMYIQPTQGGTKGLLLKYIYLNIQIAEVQYEKLE